MSPSKVLEAALALPKKDRIDLVEPLLDSRKRMVWMILVSLKT